MPESISEKTLPKKLLFVCLGNICRSPSAENIMNYLVTENGLSDQIISDSAGTANYHTGASPDRRMAMAAKKRGIDLVGRARQFTKQDFEEFDLILAMDRSNYQNILALAPEGNPEQEYRDKVKLMCSFCTSYSDQEVPDPYFGEERGFDYVINLLFDACSGLLDSLK
jgi:protein-tyrosine phosphatase